MLLQPLYIVLDTAHLNRWADAKHSRDAARRAEARQWESWLEGSGYIVLVCQHHIIEMANHVEEIAARRLRFLAELPFVAWIGVASDRTLGTVVTVLGQEVRAALNNPAASWREVRDAAKPCVIQAGTGAQMLGAEPEAWLTGRPEFAAQAVHARRVVAFSRLNTVDIAHKPIAELLNGRVRRNGDLRRQLELMAGTIAVNIRLRGDRRIEDPDALAAEFMRDVEHMADPHASSAAEIVLRGLAEMGVGLEDIGPDSTLGNLLELGLFRLQLRIAAEKIGVTDPQELRRIRPEQLPTWAISEAIKHHLPDVPSREGGELNDSHLLCLTAYADVTMVDKRTLEGVRRLRQKDLQMAPLLGRIERAADLQKIIAMLSR